MDLTTIQVIGLKRSAVVDTDWSIIAEVNESAQ
jgi:hypothetical protein